MELENGCMVQWLVSCYMQQVHAFKAQMQESKMQYLPCLAALQTNSVYILGGTIQEWWAKADSCTRAWTGAPCCVAAGVIDMHYLHALFNDESCDAMRTLVLLCARIHHQGIGNSPIGAPHLGAVQHITAILLVSTTPHADYIRPRSWLTHS